MAAWIAPFVMVNWLFLGFIYYWDPDVPVAYTPLNSVISTVVVFLKRAFILGQKVVDSEYNNDAVYFYY